MVFRAVQTAWVMAVQGAVAGMLDMDGAYHFPCCSDDIRSVNGGVQALTAARFACLPAAVEDSSAKLLAFMLSRILVARHSRRMFATGKSLDDLLIAFDVV